MGIEIIITQSTITRLTGLDNSGFYEIDKDVIISNFGKDIKDTLFKKPDEVNKDDEEDKEERVDRATNMHNTEMILFKFFIECILPRVGSTNQPRWCHRAMLLQINKGNQVNLAGDIFDHLCTCIDNSWRKHHKHVPYIRLLSELFLQSKIIYKLESLGDIDIGVEYGHIMAAELLDGMLIIPKKDVLKSAGFSIQKNRTPLIPDFPQTIKELSSQELADAVKLAIRDFDYSK